MRLYIKRAILIMSVCFGIWICISYVSLVETPIKASFSSRNDDMSEIERRIERLEQELHTEIKNSKELLMKFNNQFTERKLAAENEKDVNANDVHQSSAEEPVIAVLVMACNRVTISRCLDNLIKYRPSKTIFPIIVSQDCDHGPTYDVIKRYVTPDSGVMVVQQPEKNAVELPRQKIKFRGYYHIARHYRFALNHTFYTLGHQAAIMVEDDLDVASDFFEYFLGTYSLLKKDPSIWCVSAWNDNGKAALIDQQRPEMLHRTDFFPGLGWMMRRAMWDELQPKWPEAFFDDWLRNPDQTKGRVCIRPEISRTITFGKVGVSKGLFFDMHLRHIVLNEQLVQFTKMDLDYLIKDRYDPWFIDTVYNRAQAVDVQQLRELNQTAVTPAPPGGALSYRVIYSTNLQYKKTAKSLGLMDDFRSGIPRTAYKGVISCHFKGHRVYIAPQPPIEKYDPSWS